MTGETIFTVSLSSLTFDKLSTWSVFEGGNLHTNFLLQLGLQKKAITVAFEIGLYPDVPCKLCPLGGEVHLFERVQILTRKYDLSGQYFFPWRSPSGNDCLDG
jgi:hypothetical protein